MASSALATSVIEMPMPFRTWTATTSQIGVVASQVSMPTAAATRITSPSRMAASGPTELTNRPANGKNTSPTSGPARRIRPASPALRPRPNWR
jgi:hypothetical protein